MSGLALSNHHSQVAFDVEQTLTAASHLGSFDLSSPVHLRCVADSPIGNKLLESHSYRGNSANNVHHHGGDWARTLLVFERISRCVKSKVMDPLRHEFGINKTRF